jgi:protein-tyrosine kinase
MSRVHEAIRRAEREARREPAAASPSERGLIQAFRQETPAVAIEPATQPLVPQEPSGSPIRSQSVSARLPVLHDSKLVALSAPRSPASEQYRALKTKLFQMRNGRKLKSILVTSAEASDGKTMTAVNLALTIAQEIEQRVLLIDCDLRRPSVHKMLGFPKTDGLADFLSQNMSYSSVVLPTIVANLCVIPAGSIPENPAELLNTEKMKEFLSSVSQAFHWVVLDSPPVVPLADAELLSSLVDGTLLVVRACKTPAELITNAVQALKNGNILGVVFNGTQTSRKSDYSYYSYGSPKA